MSIKRGVSMNPFAKSLAAAGYLAAFTTVTLAVEIEGKVATVDGPSITITSTSKLLPAVGDKFGVFVEVPGVGKASVGNGTIIRVEDDTIAAIVDKATGTVKSGQLVTITSRNPHNPPSAAGEYQVGDQIVVIREHVLTGAGQSVTNKVEPGFVLTIEAIKDDLLRVTNGRSGWLDKSDAIPFNSGALDRFTEMIAAAPNDPQLYRARGIVHGKLGRHEKAIEDFTRAIQIKPDAMSYHSRGNVYRNIDEFDRAIADFTQTLRLDNNTVTLSARAGAWLFKGEYDKAIDDYNEALRLDSKHSFPYLGRGMAHAKRADYESAIADFNMMMRLDPRFFKSYRELALLLATCPNPRIRDGKRAVEQATKACELSGWKDASAFNALAAAYAEAGDFEKAIQWQNKAIEQPSGAVDGAAKRDRSNYGDRLALYRAGKPCRAETNTIVNWGTVINPDGDCTIREADSKLTMNIPAGNHDLWYGGDAKFNAPRSLQEISGDFTAQVKVTAPFGAVVASPKFWFKGAGLLVWDSKQHYLRLERNFLNNRYGQLCYSTPLYDRDGNRRNGYKVADATLFAGESTWLRIERSGKTFVTSISHDGEQWITTAVLKTEFPDNVQIGVQGLCIADHPFAVEFQDFTLRRESPAAVATVSSIPIAGLGDVIDPDDDCTITTTSSKLKISVPAGSHDFWYGRKPFNAPRVLQDVEGDFEVLVKVTADWTAKPLESGKWTVGAGLIVMESEQHYFRVERNRFVNKGTWSYAPPIYDRNEKRLSKWSASSDGRTFRGESTWLWIRRAGQKFTTALSHDGRTWSNATTLETTFPKKVRVGILALNYSAGPFVATFDGYKLTKK